MNRVLSICMLFALCLLYLLSAVEASVVVPLPPLAKAGEVDNSGKSWRQSGDISGSVAKAHGDFSAAMARGGWVLKKTISLGRTPKRSELTLWRKGNDQVLLMIWEKHAGLCGFSWGLE